MKVLIVGMGIGQLYKSMYPNDEVITVDIDPAKGPTFTNLAVALNSHKPFDIAHVCTPNFTHKEIAEAVAPHTKLMFVEKPGLVNAKAWQKLVMKYPKCRITMSKNNMWRPEVAEFKRLFNECDSIDLSWENEDRVPGPGTWFTNQELSYGGVSRDLLPHLLSLVAAMGPHYAAKLESASIEQQWQLSSLTRSDYGIVNPNGVYNVDDTVTMKLRIGKKMIYLESNWRTLDADNRGIVFYKGGVSDTRFELGLCPDEVYGTMIADCYSRLDDDVFWNYMNAVDYWIHKMVDKLEDYK